MEQFNSKDKKLLEKLSKTRKREESSEQLGIFHNKHLEETFKNKDTPTNEKTSSTINFFKQNKYDNKKKKKRIFRIVSELNNDNQQITLFKNIYSEIIGIWRKKTIENFQSFINPNFLPENVFQSFNDTTLGLFNQDENYEKNEYTNSEYLLLYGNENLKIQCLNCLEFFSYFNKEKQLITFHFFLKNWICNNCNKDFN